jgi:hypothetical protein
MPFFCKLAENNLLLCIFIVCLGFGMIQIIPCINQLISKILVVDKWFKTSFLLVLIWRKGACLHNGWPQFMNAMRRQLFASPMKIQQLKNYTIPGWETIRREIASSTAYPLPGTSTQIKTKGDKDDKGKNSNRNRVEIRQQLCLSAATVF